MVYKYKILKDKNLIIKYHSGLFNLVQLFNTAKLTSEDKDYLPTMDVINDIRNCTIVMDNNMIDNFIESIKSTKEIYDKRKIVFLTKTPNQVVFSNLIKLYKNETMIDVFITTTLEKSFIKLMISEMDYDLLKQIIHDLKH